MDLQVVRRLIVGTCELFERGAGDRGLEPGERFPLHWQGPHGEDLGWVTLVGGSEGEHAHAVYRGPEGSWSMLLGKRGRPIGYPMPVYVGAKA